MRKTKKLSNLLHTYCDVDHARDISNRQSVTSTVHIFNGTIINWSAKKQSETSRSSPNAETRAMYTGVLDQNCIRELFIPTGYPIGPPSKIYEDNQATIKRVLADIITPQAKPLNVLITSLYEINLRKKFKWWIQDQTCNLLTLILNLMAEKFFEMSLIMLLESNYILLQDHFIISNFILASFMSQITSIVSKIRRVRSKRKKPSACNCTIKARAYQI